MRGRSMPSPRDPQLRNRRRQEGAPGGWLWFVILLGLGLMLYFMLMPNTGVIDYTDFMKLAKEQKFEKVVIRDPDRAIGEFHSGVIDNLPTPIKKQVRYNRVETMIPDSER